MMTTAAVFLAAALTAAPERLILLNGKVWTGDTPSRFVEAVVIEDNRIAAVGTSEEIRSAWSGRGRTIDLGGRLVVPGFIDNHVHFVDGGLQMTRVALRDAATPQEFARRIGEHAKKLGKGAWIVGGEWDHQLWSPPELPTRALIDTLTPDNPVFVSRLDGHMALANTAALRLAGITRETPDPPGGSIVRDSRGEPTGVLKDAAMGPVWEVIPAASVDERVTAARSALRHAASLGVTALCDMSGGEAYDDFRAYQRIEREGGLTARIDLFTPIAVQERLVRAGVERGFGSARLRIGFLKGFSDGSLGSATAAFYEPFDDDPKNRGFLMEPMTAGTMARWVREAVEASLHVGIHAIGDKANDEVLRIFESIPGHRGRRFRVEHAQHLNEALIRRFAAGGIIASMQPYHAIDDGRWATKKIGPQRARGTYAFRGLLDAGARLTFGSDWGVAPLDPILGIYAAVTRRTIDGKQPGGWVPEQKISVEEALRCYTVNNAWAMFREDELGRIAPGFLADIVVLSEDLFTIAPEAIERVRADITIFDGKVIFERR